MLLQVFQSTYDQHPIATSISCAFVAALLALIFATTPLRRAPSLPGPSGWPIVGSIYQRGSNPAETYRLWSKKYGDVFRMRLGNQWFVVINSIEAAEEMLVSSKYAATFQSRPVSWSFDQLLKKAGWKTITLGTSPYDDTLKRKRHLAIASVAPAAAKEYDPILKSAIDNLVKRFGEGAKSNTAVDPWPIIFEGARHISVGLHFGCTPTEVDQAFASIPFPFRRLAQIRNINGLMKDYLPPLRSLPVSTLLSEAIEVARFRNKTLEKMLSDFKSKLDGGEAKTCIAGFMLGEKTHDFNDEEMTSVGNSMISSGLESHLPNTVLWALGTLASNKSVQSKCYEAITRRETLGSQVDPDKDNDDYLMAFVKEVNRYFTTFRLSLARETTNETVWKGHWIGEGTPVLCNVHAMNRDEKVFSEPFSFKPERYMSGPESERNTPNYAFGLGRRMCPATYLVNKELYLIFTNLLSNFQLSIAEGENVFDPISSCADGYDFNMAPKAFKVSVKPRENLAN